MTKPPSSWYRRLGTWLLIPLGLVALLWIFHVPVLTAVGQFLDVSAPPIRTDYVYVLGGNPATRGFVASALLRKGLVQQVLLAPIKPSQDQKDGIALAESEKVQRMLVGRGTPPNKIRMLPPEVNSTVDEAKAINSFLGENPQAQITVVTNNFHTRRARMLFRRILGDQSNRVHFVSAPTDGFGPDCWWRSEK
ncbi:MAG: YdcF family protein, partial [Gemmataceae bacterium]